MPSFSAVMLGKFTAIEVASLNCKNKKVIPNSKMHECVQSVLLAWYHTITGHFPNYDIQSYCYIILSLSNLINSLKIITRKLSNNY